MRFAFSTFQLFLRAFYAMQESRIGQWASCVGPAAREYRPNWRNEGAFGGGGLYDWGSHFVDQLWRLMWPARFGLKWPIAGGMAVDAAGCGQHFAGLREQSRRPRRRIADRVEALRRGEQARRLNIHRRRECQGEGQRNNGQKARG